MQRSEPASHKLGVPKGRDVAMPDVQGTDGVAVDACEELKIASIECVPLVVPLPREYRGSYYGMRNRTPILTRIVTEDGLVGAAYAGDEDANLRQIVAVIRDEIAPLLIGQDAMASERCWERVYPATYDQLRDRRIALVALASVDHAIWDAIGKALGVALWKLWGGHHARLPVNIIGGYYGSDLGLIRDEVAQWREMGFFGCKFKVGGLLPAADAERLVAAREAAGPEFIITIDANQGYTLPAALELCHRVADLDIRWFEEPCVWDNDHRDMREVRVRGGIPVCAGQSEHSPVGCREMMERGAIDVCNFDASWSGGYTNWRRMAGFAHTYNVELAHHEEPQVAAHLLASQPHGTYLEVFHPERDPVWWNLIVNRPAIEDRHVTMSDAPGFGWRFDEDFISHYRVDV